MLKQDDGGGHMYPDDIVLDNDLNDADDGEIDRAEKTHSQDVVLSLRKIDT